MLVVLCFFFNVFVSLCLAWHILCSYWCVNAPPARMHALRCTRVHLLAGTCIYLGKPSPFSDKARPLLLCNTRLCSKERTLGFSLHQSKHFLFYWLTCFVKTLFHTMNNNVSIITCLNTIQAITNSQLLFTDQNISHPVASSNPPSFKKSSKFFFSQ